MEIEVNYTQCENYRHAIHSWVVGWGWVYPMFVTVTAKQGYKGHYISDYALQQCVKHLVKRLEAEFYGSIRRRKGARLHFLPAGETSANNRRHFHFIIDNPLGLVREEYQEEVRTNWKKTDWADREINVQEYHPDRHHLAYVTKIRTKPEYDLGFLWDLVRKTI